MVIPAKRWMATAVVVAATLAACGSTTAPRTTTSTAPPTTASAPTTTTTVPTPTTAAAACSATRLSPVVDPDPALPAPAATMRADLVRASATCDWALLAALVDRNGIGVRYTFGSPGDPIAFWRDADENGHGLPPMFALRTLLGLPSTSQTLPNGAVQYVWPAAFATEHPSDAQLQQIADAGLYPLPTLQQWRASGNGYLGYRVIITAGGDWTAFVAGD